MKKLHHLKSILTASVLLSLGWAGTASATTLFSDSLQGDLSQWDNRYDSAVLIDDPFVAGGKALTFNVPRGAGDIFSAATFTSSTSNTFVLSYDYLGIGAGGGYVGIDNAAGETWLSGDGSYGTPFNNPDTGTWQHVSFAFTSDSAVRLKLEEWGGQNQVAQQALFKNLVLTDADGASVSAVPEPETYAMLLAGLGLMGCLTRRQAKK